MKLLLWVPPWAAHGDLHFYNNAVQKHLIPQGNILISQGWDVTLFLPESLYMARSVANKKIKIIDFSIDDQINCFGSLNDLSVELYQNPNSEGVSLISDKLSNYLEDYYDVVLLWETPVPFLEKKYPNTLIVHQMPGAFSRAPYPHTITFDTLGLYNKSTLTKYSSQIKSGNKSADNDLAQQFISKSKELINSFQPFSRNDLTDDGKYNKLKLVPLQVSAHYAFQADTPYSNQMEFLLDVLKDTDENTGIVVTQYVTPRISDTILSPETLSALRKKWPNLIFDTLYDKVNGISQLLLPLIDEVVTCSSSIGLQAVAYTKKLNVYGNTFLRPFSTEQGDLGVDQKTSLNILSFILNKYQPLAKSITKDGVFLSHLLTRLFQLKVEGKLDFDKLPSFNEFDNNYSVKLLEEFNGDRVAKELSELKLPIGIQTTELRKFKRFVNDESIRVLSFDVFDTLVNRPTEVPIDIFKILESKMLELTNGIAENFARVRQVTENELRKSGLSDEITLEEIYDNIKLIYQLDDEIISQMKLCEINTEIKLIQARPFGRKLWDIAVQTRKPIYIISDMYLPHDTVTEILEKSGYTGYQKLYLSSDIGFTKKEGQLFDYFLNDIGIKPENVLHVGDNRVADNEKPKSRGMKSYRLLRAIDRMRGNDFYSKIYHPKLGSNEVSRTVLAGLTAQRLFDKESGPFEKNSHFFGQPFNLGFAGLGPLLIGYMLWLGRQAKNDGITNLYFLSREGWLLKEVYDILHKTDKTAVPSTYLYASRRATRVASLQTKGDVVALAGHPYQAGCKVGQLLLDRFGVDINDYDSGYLNNAGYENSLDALSSDPLGRNRFSILCANLSEIILYHAKKERENYLAYLDSVSITQSEKPAVVDIGWRANMQGALSKLLNKPLPGYYYATLQGSENWLSHGLKIRAYMGESLSANHPSVILKNKPLFEYLICHVEPSLIRMDKISQGIKPVFRNEEKIGFRRELIDKIHHGTIQFANDFIKNFQEFVPSIWIDPFLAESVLSSFMLKPNKCDACLLLAHNFEDALGGVNNKYIISPLMKDYEINSVWKDGAHSVYAERNVIAPVAPKKVIKSAKVNVPQVLNPASDRNESVIYSNKSFKLPFERIIIKALVSEKKYKKYVNNRQLFFKDVKSPFIRRLYKIEL